MKTKEEQLADELVRQELDRKVYRSLKRDLIGIEEENYGEVILQKCSGKGDWFEIAASAVLFGLSVVFLPFLIRARPVRDLIGDRNRLLLVLGVDFALFFNLLTMIDSRGHLTLNSLLFSVGTIGGIVCVIYAIIKNRKTDNHTPYGKS